MSVFELWSSFNQEPWRYPFGGSNTTRKICLKSAICQTMSMCHHIGRPRARCFMAILNSIYATVKHIDTRVYNFGNFHGLFVRFAFDDLILETNFFHFSKKSSIQVIDRITGVKNPTILRWKAEMEELRRLGCPRLMRTRASQGVTGFTVGVDNVGAVRFCFFFSSCQLFNLPAFVSNSEMIKIIGLKIPRTKQN